MEMWRKTVLKRAMKYAPKSAELNHALEVDTGDFEVISNRPSSQNGPVPLLQGRGVSSTLARLSASVAPTETPVEEEEDHSIISD